MYFLKFLKICKFGKFINLNLELFGLQYSLNAPCKLYN